MKTTRIDLNPKSNWLTWLVPVLLVIVIIALAGWAITRREAPALASVDVGNGVKLELVAALTKARPTVDLSPRSRQLWDKLPRFVRNFWPFRPPADAQVIQDLNLDEEDTLLVFVPKGSEGVARSKDDLARAVNTAPFNWVRFNYGDGFFSKLVRLDQDYMNWNGSKLIYKARVETIPVLREQLELEFVKVGNNWGYGEPQVNSVLVTSAQMKNPVHQRISPLTGAVALPASVTHGDVTVTINQLLSRISREGGTEKVNGYTVHHGFGKVLKASKGVGTDPPVSVARLEVTQTGTTTTEWGFDSIQTFYGQSHVPFVDTGKFYPKSGEPHLYMFDNDLAVLKQPVLVKVQLVHRDNFGPGEKQIIELPIPADGNASPPALQLGQVLKFWNQDVTVCGVMLNTTHNVKDMEVGTDKGLTVIFKDVKDNPRLQEAKLVKNDGSSLDISAFGNRSGSTSGGGGSFSYRSFDVEEALKKNDGGKISDYTTLTVEVLSPKLYPKTFDFIVQPEPDGTAPTEIVR